MREHSPRFRPDARPAGPSCYHSGTVSLRFRADRTFTIVQLTDLHGKNGEPAEHEPEAWERRA